MKLFGSTTSPYVRIIRVLAQELGIVNDMQIIWNSLTEDSVKEELTKLNPLTKIPFLVDEDVYVADTVNIINYLQEKTNNYSYALDKNNRWQEELCLTQIFGALDAGVLYFYETQNDKVNKVFIEKYIARIYRVLNFLENNIDNFKNSLTILTMTIVATHGFFAFRMNDLNLFGRTKKLEELVQNLMKRDCFKNSQPYLPK